MHLELIDALGDCGVTGQEARAHAIRDVAEAQVEARGLDLVGIERARGHDPTGLRQFGNHAIRQNALVSHALSSTSS